ncbi:CopD family protein [Actinotalea sp. M2MS4P-6]|uniref:CopD family protein n=1 Tax=Actinotalea sp. M2MS4P-6 TaxID=2983762 RepID=UPI0021E4C2FE|nr:CopD family protein [Actinotalea sp. M2MS4P-6]MCV2396542.1 CopD family protein [Actinotalea sp. M2MS4P-6]
MTVSETEEGLVEVATAPLAEGVYELDWTVVALDDGHPSRGSVAFGAGVRPAVSASGDRSPGTGRVVLRWTDLAAIMLAIGAVAVTGRVLGAMGPTGAGAQRRARRIGAGAALVAVVTGALTPVVAIYSDGAGLAAWAEASRATLLGSTWGRLWLTREAFVVLLAGVMWSWARRRGALAGHARLLAGVCLGGVAWFEAAAGHAAALAERSVPAVLAAAVHLLGAGVWVGGLAVLSLSVVHATRGADDTPRQLLLPVWRAFSAMAAVTVGVVLATGIYESGRQVPDLAAATTTRYGSTLAVKIVLVAVALTLAGVNTALLHPRVAGVVVRRLSRRDRLFVVRPRRFPTFVVAVEIGVLGLAVGTAAVLTSEPTAREVSMAADRSELSSSNVDGLLITFQAVPGGSDRTRLVVRTRSTVRPEPAPVTGVAVDLAAAAGARATVTMTAVEPGHYEGTADRLAPGDWTAQVSVQREGLPPTTTEAVWTVADRATGPTAVEIVATLIAVLLLLGTLGALAASRRGRAVAEPPVLIGAGRI